MAMNICRSVIRDKGICGDKSYQAIQKGHPL